MNAALSPVLEHLAYQAEYSLANQLQDVHLHQALRHLLEASIIHFRAATQNHLKDDATSRISYSSTDIHLSVHTGSAWQHMTVSSLLHSLIYSGKKLQPRFVTYLYFAAYSREHAAAYLESSGWGKQLDRAAQCLVDTTLIAAQTGDDPLQVYHTLQNPPPRPLSA